MATQPEIVEQLFEVALALEPAQREASLDANEVRYRTALQPQERQSA